MLRNEDDRIIEAMEEPSASVEVAKAVPTVADTRVAGIFLIVRAVKARA